MWCGRSRETRIAPITGSTCLIATRYRSVVAGESRAFLELSHLLSVCETVIASAGQEAVLSLATSVTNAARAMPASFFVPWNVLDVYRFLPLLSVPEKACNRQVDGPRCCI